MKAVKKSEPKAHLGEATHSNMKATRGQLRGQLGLCKGDDYEREFTHLRLEYGRIRIQQKPIKPPSWCLV
jgi:hypothetical protein